MNLIMFASLSVSLSTDLRSRIKIFCSRISSMSGNMLFSFCAADKLELWIFSITLVTMYMPSTKAPASEREVIRSSSRSSRRASALFIASFTIATKESALLALTSNREIRS